MWTYIEILELKGNLSLLKYDTSYVTWLTVFNISKSEYFLLVC